jgi:hypothetical protein
MAGSEAALTTWNSWPKLEINLSLRTCLRVPGKAGAILPVKARFEWGSARPTASVAGGIVTLTKVENSSQRKTSNNRLCQLYYLMNVLSHECSALR